jgi:hypothetical protein
VEWTTQSGEGNGHDTQPLPPIPESPQPHFREESVLPPVAQASSGFEHCPSCGALIAVDQRYCLECGQRRGEPRLPFMDAVVFMDAMNKPPEAPSETLRKTKRGGISPNAALIAGVGVLLLALGIGVLIGRSGNHGATQAAAPPQVVTVGGAGGGEAAEASSSSTGSGKATGGPASTKGKTKKQIVKQKTQEAESGQGAEEVLHTANGVKMAPATQKIGASCDKDVAGCSKSGKFDGSFFGEEE